MLRFRRLVQAALPVVLVASLAASLASGATSCKGCSDEGDAPKNDVPPSNETMAQQQARREINADNAEDTATALAAQIEIELAAERAAAPTDAGTAAAAGADGGTAQP